VDKFPFDVGTAFDRIEGAVKPWPEAVLFQLAKEGYASVFELLLACLTEHR
jgi:endonuclease-3